MCACACSLSLIIRSNLVRLAMRIAATGVKKRETKYKTNKKLITKCYLQLVTRPKTTAPWKCKLGCKRERVSLRETATLSGEGSVNAEDASDTSGSIL